MVMPYKYGPTTVYARTHILSQTYHVTSNGTADLSIYPFATVYGSMSEPPLFSDAYNPSSAEKLVADAGLSFLPTHCRCIPVKNRSDLPDRRSLPDENEPGKRLDKNFEVPEIFIG